jgi:hypothetical protein
VSAGMNPEIFGGPDHALHRARCSPSA